MLPSRKQTIRHLPAQVLVQNAQKDLLTSPKLLRCGPDLLWRQDEAIVASIGQLNGVGEVGAANAVHVVRSGAGGGVKSRAAGAKGKGGAPRRAVADGLAHERGRPLPRPELGGVEVVPIPKGRQDVLAVAMPVDEELDADRVPELAHVLVETGVLGRVGRLESLVYFGAWVGGCSVRVRIPSKLPVAVDVAPIASRIGARRGQLTILPP